MVHGLCCSLSHEDRCWLLKLYQRMCLQFNRIEMCLPAPRPSLMDTISYHRHSQSQIGPKIMKLLPAHSNFILLIKFIHLCFKTVALWAFLPLVLKQPETWSTKTVFFWKWTYHKASKLYSQGLGSSLRWKIQITVLKNKPTASPWQGVTSFLPIFFSQPAVFCGFWAPTKLSSKSLASTVFEAFLGVCSLQKAATCIFLVWCQLPCLLCLLLQPHLPHLDSKSFSWPSQASSAQSRWNLLSSLQLLCQPA